jgi:Regulator of G protein signaling domain
MPTYDLKARERLPTLFEVLNRRTQSPVDLWSFYVYMREQHRGVDYLDFWLDVVQHLSLCRHYVRSLRQSIMANSERDGSSRTSSVLLDTLIQEGTLDDTDSHRLSAFLRGEDSAQNGTLYRLSALLDAMNMKEQGIAELHSPVSRTDNFISRVNQQQAIAPTNDDGDDFDYNEKHRNNAPIVPGPSSGFIGSGDSPVSRDSLDNRSFYSARGGSQPHLPLDSSPVRSQRGGQGQQHYPNDGYRRVSQGTSQAEPRRSQAGEQRALSMNGETIERLFPRRNNDINDTGSFVTRQDIRQSSHRILVTYFIPGAERELVLPARIMMSVKQAIEVDGRDDPEVFDEAREYVFQAMERDAFPAFLATKALGNLSPAGSLVRLIFGLFSLFAAFWVGFVLIFLDWQPKITRLWLILPFGIGSYCIFSSLYNLDPIMATIGFSESNSPKNIVPIQEPYVKKLLLKRSLYVFTVVVVTAAIFVIIFALVPGKRL